MGLHGFLLIVAFKAGQKGMERSDDDAIDSGTSLLQNIVENHLAKWYLPFFERFKQSADHTAAAEAMYSAAEERGFVNIVDYQAWLVENDVRMMKAAETKSLEVETRKTDQERLADLLSEISKLKDFMHRSGKLPALNWLSSELGCRPQRGEDPLNPLCRAYRLISSITRS